MIGPYDYSATDDRMQKTPRRSVVSRRRTLILHRTPSDHSRIIRGPSMERLGLAAPYRSADFVTDNWGIGY